MSYHLRLIKALSYSGIITATKKKPDVYVADKKIADAAVATGYFMLVGGEEKPQVVVKGQFLKLDYSHVEYVLDCLKKNTTKVRNIKAYLLSALYNAVSTIGHYYQAEVNHDLYGGGIRDEEVSVK